MSFSICEQSWPKSDCADAQSDQDLHCLLTESLDATECMNGEQRPGGSFAHVQDDLNLHIMRMFKVFFTHIIREMRAHITWMVNIVALGNLS